jgi:hypothetical protein
METVEPELEKQGTKIVHQPYSKVLPFIETVQRENQWLHKELGNSASEKELFKKSWWKFNYSLR